MAIAKWDDPSVLWDDDRVTFDGVRDLPPGETLQVPPRRLTLHVEAREVALVVAARRTILEVI